MAESRPLTALDPGAEVLIGGDRLVRVPDEVIAAFRPGDALIPVAATGELLHVPAGQRRIAADAVARAESAFRRMGGVADGAISRFYEEFARRLEDDAAWAQVVAANATDVDDARRRGRSTTRLAAGEKLRQEMISGLRGWITFQGRRGKVLESVAHDGWTVELAGAELGVVGFVFEGRPNVLADATGVLRGGNTVVFRIGSDALRTAKAIMALALEPALAAAGLPEGAVVLVESAEHAAGWALFSDARLALAVSRGSGPAVATLGALARQAGVPVSLHGTGGAWIVAAQSAPAEAFAAAVYHSLDRKVCNTLNVCCIPRTRTVDLVPVFLDAVRRAGERRNQPYRLHVVEGGERFVPPALFTEAVTVRRAEGDAAELRATLLPEDRLGDEWEWEETPELSLMVVDSTDHAVELFNRYSPQFIASLISADADEHERFYGAVNASFVGNGFTRWVDGQFALDRPELGLSNWQFGRLFGRGGVLSGDSVYTVRTRARQSNPDLAR